MWHKNSNPKLLAAVEGLELVEMVFQRHAVASGNIRCQIRSDFFRNGRQQGQFAAATGAEVCGFYRLFCLMHLRAYFDKQQIPVKCISSDRSAGED